MGKVGAITLLPKASLTIKVVMSLKIRDNCILKCVAKSSCNFLYLNALIEVYNNGVTNTSIIIF